MARIYFKDANKKKADSAIPGPGKTVWKGLLVQDDLIHIGISRAANGLHRVSSKLNRKTLAFSTLFAGVATNTVLDQPDDLKKLGWSLFGNAFCLITGKMIIDWKMDNDNDVNKFADGLLDKFLRLVRMPVTAVGATVLGICGLAFKFPGIELSLKVAAFGQGVACTCMGIAFYLISSSTGAYNDFKEWKSNLAEKIEKKF